MDVFQLHRTFPQGSNYWGSNLSQVEMILGTQDMDMGVKLLGKIKIQEY